MFSEGGRLGGPTFGVDGNPAVLQQRNNHYLPSPTPKLHFLTDTLVLLVKDWFSIISTMLWMVEQAN